MKLPLQGRFGFVASDACSAPKPATRAPSASWLRSSATNSCAAKKTNTKIPQASCSLTAEAGRISRGSSAPQRRPRLFFLHDLQSWVISYRSDVSTPNSGDMSRRASVAAAVTSSQPCTSEQEISTRLLVEDEGAQSRLQIASILANGRAPAQHCTGQKMSKR